MIWILGGTHEVPLLLDKLSNYDNIIVTVTTDEAREFLPKDLKVRVGSMTEEEKLSFVKENDIKLIVDMTHPFARHIKKSIADFSKKYNIGNVLSEDAFIYNNKKRTGACHATNSFIYTVICDDILMRNGCMECFWSEAY